jgi:hypothetical protein
VVDFFYGVKRSAIAKTPSGTEIQSFFAIIKMFLNKNSIFSDILAFFIKNYNLCNLKTHSYLSFVNFIRKNINDYINCNLFMQYLSKFSFLSIKIIKNANLSLKIVETIEK